MAHLGRVLIIGGGIGGLSAALALRKVGFDVAVFEQAPELREVGAGVGLWSNAMASLEQLGVAEAIRATSTPLRTMCAANPRGATISKVDLDTLGPEFASASCYVALRRKLLAALASAVPAEVVHRAFRATRIESLEDRVRVHFENGRVEEGDLLVGADGLHSAVRPAVVGADAVRYSGQTCFRGIAHVPPTEPGVLREVQGRGQRGAVCPVDRETVYWWVAFNAPANRIEAVGARKALLMARYGDWPFGLHEAIAAAPDDEILQNDLVDRAPIRTYARDRLVLVGDAAHPTTPNLGQGANMAIDDAIALARALHNEPSVSAAFARYQRERLERTRSIVERSWRFGRMCLWDSAVGVAMRETMVRLTPASMMRDVLRWQILETVGPLE